MDNLKAMDRVRTTFCSVKGITIHSTARMTGVAKNTVAKLLEIGHACTTSQNKPFRKLICKRIQYDEIWSFVGSKERKTSAEKKGNLNGDSLDVGRLYARTPN
ncbi:MAG TPA: hypothetical protein VFC44_16910 [Candidatus Saccharimonadales bacterium]|nr:hypothetical protein [Candidatus Saccharimonadales bacterium]